MSKSSNMLRTRRRDNNVKPNRRLDRKSSRGMLYENEELRLKTININAEVERGQSDIKKLKRENDQLRREIWYLRDEYDKLDKLLREKQSEGSSSSSSGTSETDSCSSCSEESETVESSQNLENVQKTNLKKLNEDFDHLSVVQEENSTENSDKNSTTNRASENTSPAILEKDIIKPDQSYPTYNPKLPQSKSPKHFFSPINSPKENENVVNDQFLGPDDTYAPQQSGYYENTQSNFYPGLTLPPLYKSTTDVIVKTDNQAFNTLRSHSSFSNGGNLEELLNDIETISHDILKISNSQNQSYQNPSFPTFNPDNYPENLSDIVTQIQNANLGYIATPKIDNYEIKEIDSNLISAERPYKSELNVVLMPTPMQLIGVEKYKNIQKSCESLNTRSAENLTTPQTMKIIPEASAGPHIIISPDQIYNQPQENGPFFVPVPPNCPNPEQNLLNEQTNPFYFGTVIPPPESPEFFTARYLPETVKEKEDLVKRYKQVEPEVYSSKTNLLDAGLSSDHVSSENEENLKFKTSPKEKAMEKPNGMDVDPCKSVSAKSPKLGMKNKVSIHFKGKKDKAVKSKDSKSAEVKSEKRGFFDLKLPLDKHKKGLHQKTPSVESKVSIDQKCTTSGESKTSTDNKHSKTDSKTGESSSVSDHKTSKLNNKTLDSKTRKSSSASPERKHGHREGRKTHKKHKKSDRSKTRRSSMSIDRLNRERSYSVCTDRSNILDHRGPFYYDDFTTSDRERTNSLSSCDTIKGRKLSNISHFPATGKIPWCGCWGNGCL